MNKGSITKGLIVVMFANHLPVFLVDDAEAGATKLPTGVVTHLLTTTVTATVAPSHVTLLAPDMITGKAIPPMPLQGFMMFRK
jgi:hypothetical protein